MATEHKLKFLWQNDTKGAVRYAEVLPNGRVANAPNDPGAVIGTLYLRQSAFGPEKNFPKELTVLVAG